MGDTGTFIRNGIVFGSSFPKSNPNLLDNPWFTVNQRGLSSYASGSSRYTVDRWKDNQGNADITVNSDGSLTIANSSASASEFTQYLDNIMENVAGKDMTLSVLFSDGSIKSGNIIIPTTIPDTATILEAFDVANQYRAIVGVRKNKPYVIFIVRANVTVSIKAIKLELGSISTLDLDTVPNYAMELAKCQRYFIRYKSTVDCAVGFATTTTAAWLNFFFPVTMRTMPSIVYNGTPKICIAGYVGANGIDVTRIDANILDQNSFKVYVAVASGLTAGQCCTLHLRNGAYIDLSADL